MGRAEIMCGCGNPNCKSGKYTREQLEAMTVEASQLADAIGRLAIEASHDDVKLSGLMRAFIQESANQDYNATEVLLYSIVAIAHAAGENPLTLIAKAAEKMLRGQPV